MRHRGVGGLELLLTQARDCRTSDWGELDNVKFVLDSLLCSVLTGHGLDCVIICNL